MKSFAGCCVTLLGASLCSAQVNNGHDVNEWTAFAVPAVEPRRMGAVPDHQFQTLKQGGPWQTQPVAVLIGSEQQLMTLARQSQWGEALALLKASNPDPNVSDELGATPLSLAAGGGQTELVKELLRRGAEPDRRGAGGMTPLGVAAFNGHELVVRELLRRGARTDVPGATGQWPLHLACATGQQRVVKLLMVAGADVRASNRQGRHALAEAAYFGQLGVMQQLVEAGVSADLLDLHGRNALHAAAMGQQREAVTWLMQQGLVPTMALTQVLLDQADQWGNGLFAAP
ncbi:ankyrin repeat domain-containing protein [Aquabacterium sp.]|uniref:ankyrin repeat domain-containing protein n=1 Tax=Aquabacterium sp. TaxID=1872578 RepID=UPI001986FD1C|nr:ankyrin repeat domain-containing protein [Aquabacterium sp.]MBC7702025.1 ankyrin repeat domain-containing protein [Aquabacterium sp.]